MTDGLTDRLNQVLPTITSDAFLRGKGLGNEIAFYIFDYPPEAELRVREHLQFVLKHLPRIRPGVRVCHVHLLDFVLTYLRQRHLLDKAMAMQQTKGDAFILRQLAPILHPNKIAPVFAEVVQPAQHDLVLVSGDWQRLSLAAGAHVIEQSACVHGPNTVSAVLSGPVRRPGPTAVWETEERQLLSRV